MHHPVSDHVVGGVDPNATAGWQGNPATSSPYPAPGVPPPLQNRTAETLEEKRLCSDARLAGATRLKEQRGFNADARRSTHGGGASPYESSQPARSLFPTHRICLNPLWM